MKNTATFHEVLSTWHQPANDNGPITADSFSDIAARRAFVQRPQGKPDPVLSLPTLERLGRVAPEVVPLWRYWRDVTIAAAGDVFALPEFAADYATAGELKPENGLVDESDEPSNPGFSMVEQDLEIRPTVDEMLRAIEGAGRVSVICTVQNGQRSNVQRAERPLVLGNTTLMGDLVFRGGELVRWGTFGHGGPLKPIERLRAPKGSPQNSPLRDLRHLVRTDAPIAKGAGFLAGACHSTGRSGAPLECFAEQQLERKAEDQSLRAALGAHAEILDMAIGDATAREIGERRGYHGKHAERRGIFMVNEAFAALRGLVGDNISKKAA